MGDFLATILRGMRVPDCGRAPILAHAGAQPKPAATQCRSNARGGRPFPPLKEVTVTGAMASVSAVLGRP